MNALYSLIIVCIFSRNLKRLLKYLHMKETLKENLKCQLHKLDKLFWSDHIL